ncbi:MAG: hypothetical protein JNM03_17920 [Sphingopyxis sp.]|uniref:hypothetical protein n=1 Tax=Sphingopyxis sp. TaxID=1908224 RepID=UPI001A43DDA1|nr:hypothetical protein [Sphingopyxis sp.]MBL9071864.1 hypothetical protein [Sphingopyxis sp.]
MDDRKFRRLELWEVDDLEPAVVDAATAAGLEVLDNAGVSPLEARMAQFNLEGADDRGVLDNADDLESVGVSKSHLAAGQLASREAMRVIERLAPGRAEPYLTLGIAAWVIEDWDASGADPTKV